MADYDGDDDCGTYLPHPPVLLPVISVLMLGEDKDHSEHRHKLKAFVGGKCWTTAIQGQWTMALTMPSNSQNGGHNGAVMVHGVDLWRGVPPEAPCPNAILHVTLSRRCARLLGQGAAAAAV